MSAPPRSDRDARLAPRTARVAHLDVDAFLASVEQAVHPSLRGRPVVVGGPPSGRNIVMSCTWDLRRRGVRPGMLLAEAARRCPDAIFRDGDSRAANRLREEVVRILLGFSPRVEVASIDDFFVDLAGTARLSGSAWETALEMRRAIRAGVQLPVSIGIGTGRTLARLAGMLAKPGGVAEILPGCEARYLDHLPVRELPGVGRSIGAQLERFAIHTVGDLRLVPREILFASFGRDGLVLHERARLGESRDRDGMLQTAEAVQPTHALDEGGVVCVRPPRSIHREATFEPEEARSELIESMLAYLVERAAAQLRVHGLRAGSVEVHRLYVDARPSMEEGGVEERSGKRTLSRRRPLPEPSDSTDEIWSLALSTLRSLPPRRALTKRVGVVLLRLSSDGGWQGKLFGEPGQGSGEGASRANRQRRLDSVLDELRARLGFGRVLRGASLPLGETHPLGPDGYRLRTPSLNQ